MSRKAFHQLLKKYVDGKCSGEEKQLIDEWYQLLDDHSLMPASEEEMERIEERLWKKIHNNTSAKNKPVHGKVYSAFLKTSAAAIVFALIGIGIYYSLPEKTTKESFIPATVLPSLHKTKNETTTQKRLCLKMEVL